ELVATAVAAGRARLEQERVAMAARAQFEQFFGPELAKVLTEDPTMLNGRRCEVTVLFADVRGFSSISEKLPPETTAAWMQGVLTELSDCVRAEQGVLIDYIGDELLALWGAPGAQPDHAVRAARAALAMVRRTPKIDEHWRPRVGL